jgi:signal transduction histidine kinase
MIVSIDENVKKTNTILTGILNFAKPKSSVTEKEIFSLKEIIEASKMLVQIKHHKEKVPVVLDIPNEDKIYGIKYQIQEVCFNCIDNSFEAVIEKEQHLKNPLFNDIDKTEHFVPEIKVSLKYLDDNKYQIIIKDNGIGIKQENKVKIFSAFFTTKPSSKSGSGIGSYVARRMIVESHNGDITFESKYGEGTTFFITLPLSQKKERV